MRVSRSWTEPDCHELTLIRGIRLDDKMVIDVFLRKVAVKLCQCLLGGGEYNRVRSGGNLHCQRDRLTRSMDDLCGGEARWQIVSNDDVMDQLTVKLGKS